MPLRLILDKDTLFEQIAEYSNIAPDLQHVISTSVSPGIHELTFEVMDASIQHKEQINISDDRWIFLSYHF